MGIFNIFFPSEPVKPWTPKYQPKDVIQFYTSQQSKHFKSPDYSGVIISHDEKESGWYTVLAVDYVGVEFSISERMIHGKLENAPEYYFTSQEDSDNTKWIKKRLRSLDGTIKFNREHYGDVDTHREQREEYLKELAESIAKQKERVLNDVL